MARLQGDPSAENLAYTTGHHRGLVINSLSVQAGSRALVRDVSLQLEPGQSLGIVGESGSGKSMTALALVGLLPHGVSALGSASYDGTALLGTSERAMRRIRGRKVALLLQDPFTMLNPLQNVERHILESLPRTSRPRSNARAEVRRRLAEVGIVDEDVPRRYPFQLSGGMRQRVALACALAKDPELLIADEPTTALDATIQHDILALLRRIQRTRQMSLVLITHDLKVAFTVCDRVAVMYSGGVLEEGRAADLRENPRHPYTNALLLAEPPITHARERLAALPGRVPGCDEVADRCAFSARCEWSDQRCLAGRPVLTAAQPHHRTACLRHHEIDAQLRAMHRVADDPIAPAPPPQGMLLEVAGLVKSYEQLRMLGSRRPAMALAGVDLKIGVGESVGLVGESGSGKTTVAKCILGLETPGSGEIVLDGHDISDYRRLAPHDRASVRRLVQCVFQDPFASLNPAKTVDWTLREALRMRAAGVDANYEVSRLLDLVGLPQSYLQRKPALLSGGERQRVVLARALCVAPRLLICDEPVAALDVSVQAQVLELLREIRRTQGISMLFISHDLAVVRQVTDSLVVMYRGSVVEAGPTEQVLDRPQHGYTKRLVQAASLG